MPPPERRRRPESAAPAPSEPGPARRVWPSAPPAFSQAAVRNPWPQAQVELETDPWPSLLELPDDDPAGSDTILRAWEREHRLQAEQRGL